jgi:hypothetical protein
VVVPEIWCPFKIDDRSMMNVFDNQRRGFGVSLGLVGFLGQDGISRYWNDGEGSWLPILPQSITTFAHGHEPVRLLPKRARLCKSPFR